MLRLVKDQATKLASTAGAPVVSDALQVELLRATLDRAPEAFVAIDADGAIAEFNRAAERTFGYAREEIFGRELATLLVPERHRSAYRAALGRLREAGESEWLGRRLELSALHREGHEFPVEVTVSEARMPVEGGQIMRLNGFTRDISERKLSERVLVAMQSVTQAMARAASPEQAMTLLLERLGESMGWKLGAYWQLAHDGALERAASWIAPGVNADAFEDASREVRLTCEASFPGRAVKRRDTVWVEDFAADETYPRAPAALACGLHASISVPVLREDDVVGAIEFFASELRVQDRSIATALATVGAQVGELLGVLEERQALLTSLARLALTDQLTGLPNRRAWEDGLRRELARAERDDNPVCIAVIDLDNFKQFNDEHGHQAGDAVLTEAARAWQGQLRASDLLARYGGEEFAAVIPTWPLETAVAVIERVRRATPSGLTASAGVASWNRAETPAELFGRADAALYEAKQRGRDRTVAAE
jgi:diguanylate cyclase (GGDEF)-like protein/PAS domain S-box-containing protein